MFIIVFRYSISHIDPGVVFDDSKYGRGWKNVVYNKVNLYSGLLVND